MYWAIFKWLAANAWGRLIISERQHLVLRGTIGLAVAIVSAICGMGLLLLSAAAAWAACGDPTPCNPSMPAVFASIAFGASGVVGVLVAMISGVRALVLFGFALQRAVQGG